MVQAEAGRRLAAIMFTDIVGYSALTERDEAHAIKVRDRHRAIVKPLVEQFEGRLVDATGDEALASFPSAILAVDCALAIQAALRDDSRLQLRIGIHLGDVVERDGEVIGEGVNVAARVRPLAEPGGICISDQVYHVIRNRPHVAAHSLGAKSFKNVEAPVEVYAIGPAGERIAHRSRLSRPIKVVAGLAITTALLYAAYLPNRTAILSSIAMTAPLFLSDPIEQEIGFVTSKDGVRIAYATTGSGPPLIFVLSWATHLEKGIVSPVYSPQNWIRELSEHHLFVRFDGRGFGMSDRMVDDFSLDARVADLAGVIDAVAPGGEPVSIYAVSGGGPTAIAYTARNPDRVSRLILAGTTPGLGGREPTPELEAELEQWRGMLALFRSSWDSPVVRAMMVNFLNPHADEVQQRVVSEFLAIAATGDAVAGFLEPIFFEIDLRDAASRIRTPTLVIHGTEDTTVPIEEGRILAALIPGARFEMLEGRTHVQGTILEPRDRHLIADFLAEGRGPAVAAGLQ